MGVRERVASLAVLGRSPALRAPEKVDKLDLYSEGPTVVPTLTWSSQRQLSTDAEAQAPTNPLLFSPVYRIATLTGALPVRVYELLPTEEPSAEPLPENVVPLDRARRAGVRLSRWDLEAMRTHTHRQENDEHPGFTLLHHPNPALTLQMLMAGTVSSMLRRGKAAWVKDRDDPKGPPVELWPVPAHRFRARSTARKLIDHYEVLSDTGVWQPVPVEDVCYFRLMPDMDDWADGATPMDALDTVGQFGMSSLTAMTDLFDTGILSPLWIDLHGKELTKKAQNRLEAQMNAQRRDRYGVPIMEDGATIETLGQGPHDEVLSRSAQLAREVINDTFNLPQDNDLKLLYGQAIAPVAVAIEAELVRSLFNEWPDQPAFAEFQFRDVLKGTPGERIDLHSKAILSGQETMNEARADENRPPLPGGDVAFVPLNVLPVEQAQSTQERPPADSGDGLGGDEGKDTFVSANDVVEEDAAAAAADGSYGLRAQFREQLKLSWGTQRSRWLERVSRAYANRARGLLNRELGQLRASMRGHQPQTVLVRTEVGGLPSLAELTAIIKASDPELAAQLHRYMRESGETGYEAAAAFLELQAADIAGILGDTLLIRAEAVAQRFSEVRVEAIGGLLAQGHAEGWTVRELDAAIAARYQSLATHYVDGIGRTEMAFAYEHSAYAAWRQAGVQRLEYVFGGGPCTTGVCEEQSGATVRVGADLPNVGESFDQTVSPPLHPGCTCFLVPMVEEAETGRALATGS